MKIAELFINLGIKGGDITKGALVGLKKGLTDLKESSAEAKVALAGAVYAMEQMMSASTKRGSDLFKYNQLTGQSIKDLQKYEVAARQSGVASGAVRDSLVGLQEQIQELWSGKGHPEGLARVSELVGFDLEKAKNDSAYALKQVFAYLKKEKDIARGNMVAKSFGFTPEMIGFGRHGNTDISKIKEDAILNTEESSQLAKTAVAWENFWAALNLFRDKKVAQFGLPIVSQLSGALRFVIDFTNGIQKLIEQFPILGDVGKTAIVGIAAAMIAFGGPLTALSASVTGLIYLLGEVQKFREGKDSIFSSDRDENGVAKPGAMQTALLGAESSLSDMMGGFSDFIKGKLNISTPALSSKITALPADVANPIEGYSGGGNTTVNQNISVHGNVDTAKDIGREAEKATKKAINNAARQSPALARGT